MRTSFLAMAAYLPVALGATAAEPDPSVWLRQTYDLYHRAEKDTALLKTSAPETLAPRASRALAALFKRERNCVEKSHEICALDWDFIVNGQDWELSGVKVGPLQASGDKATVTVTFQNMKHANTNIYAFVREDGAWKLDDVETHDSERRTTRISKLLKDYKSY
jgi:hypothetical protein